MLNMIKYFAALAITGNMRCIADSEQKLRRQNRTSIFVSIDLVAHCDGPAMAAGTIQPVIPYF